MSLFHIKLTVYLFLLYKQLLGLPDVDDAFEEYHADVEEDEAEADPQQMGVSQQ